jgi:cytochrome o ubiquinol oxidase subunit II
MSKNNSEHKLSHTVGIISLLLVDLACIIYLILQGKNVALFNPKGTVATEQMHLILLIVGIIFSIAIPTIILLFFIAYKYRETNEKAYYDPDARYGKKLDAAMWLVPAAFMFIIAIILWGATHKLEPQKVIASDKETVKIKAIALRWKWVFLYPEQKIATVNFVNIPQDTPVTFDLTADEAPMSAFWIPNLGGMLYAMTGHVNTLNLKGDTPGDYEGRPGEVNGEGMAGMKFTARVSTREDFDRWVQEMKSSPKQLDSAEYEKLLKPSEYVPPAFYSSYQNGLYDKVLMKYTGTAGNQSHTKEHSEH